MTAVEPVDLAAHLFFASLFLTTLVAMATSLRRRGSSDAPGQPAGASWLSKLTLGLVLLQITLGALVAGSHAGLVYNTWPDMDGHLVPPLAELLAESPWWANVFENVTLIQFDHRLFAYLVLALALANAALWARRGSDAGRRSLAFTLLALMLAQVALGIVTLLFAVPLAAALSHQLLAMFVLVTTVRLATLCYAARFPAPSSAPSGAEGPLAAHVATR
jgi:cytochrome c oxidase assembly protein subunit 15